MTLADRPENQLAQLSRAFGAYADIECRENPLYQRIAHGMAEDPDLLDIAATALGKWRPWHLFLVAVHYLLLGGAQHPLASWYGSVTATPEETADPMPAFRDFCLEHAGELRELLATRTFQANEVGRCAILLPGLAVALEAVGRPLALVDVGASAGLNLLFDRFYYRYGDGQEAGNKVSRVRLSCQVIGPHHPPIPATAPTVVSRVGIDLAPIDPRDPEAQRWLLAFGSPNGRNSNQEAALALAAADPPEVVQGDALEILPDVVDSLPEDAVACVHTAYTFHHFPPETQRRFLDEVLPAIGARRDLVWLPAERFDEFPRLQLATWLAGRRSGRVLARHHPGGAWIEWLDEQSAGWTDQGS